MSAVQLLARAGNEAVQLNPPTGLDIHLTSHGSDWYWTVFSVFAFVAILLFGVGHMTKPANERLFYYNVIASSFFLSIGYYTMASNLGWTGIQAEFNHDTVSDSLETPGIRQIFYTRYVAWFLAFPPLLTNLAVLSAIPVSTMIFTGVSIEVFVVSLLIGTLIHSTYKWGYFVFAVVALIVVGYQLLFPVRRAANDVDSDTGRTVTITGAALTTLLFIYPISWGLSEGGNVIQPDSEAVFYGVLDLVTFVIVPGFFLFAVRDVDFANLGITAPTKPLFHAEKVARYSGDTAVSRFSPEQQTPAPQPAAAADAADAAAATV